MPKVLPRLALQAADREEIERWVRAHGTPQQIMLRSHIVLAAADGQSDSAIAQALAVNRKTVTLWRARYATAGLPPVLVDASGDFAPTPRGQGCHRRFLENNVGLYLNPRNMRWCSVSTRRAKFKHWIARSRVCPLKRAVAVR